MISMSSVSLEFGTLSKIHIERHGRNHRYTMTLVNADTGETITERSGVINLSLDGTMMLSAMAGFVVAYGSGNRDERQFPDADRFDLGRKPRGHLGFGGGVHACLGASVGRMASRIAFEEFHQVVPDYARRDEQLDWMPSSTFRSPTELVLTVA